jgi:hypothetical protein
MRFDYIEEAKTLYDEYLICTQISRNIVNSKVQVTVNIAGYIMNVPHVTGLALVHERMMELEKRLEELGISMDPFSEVKP